MQHPVGIDKIETAFRKRKLLGIGNSKVPLLTIDIQMMSRNLDRTRCEINSGDPGAGARKLQKIRAHPTTNFQQTGAGVFVEAHHLRHPGRIFRITMMFNCIEELARSKFMLAAMNRPAWILSPLLARALFFWSSYGCDFH